MRLEAYPLTGTLLAVLYFWNPKPGKPLEAPNAEKTFNN